LLGGTIPDAAVADYAMKRVAQTTGQPPTAADAARAAAMVQGMKPPGDQGN
jgi:hypothetical protein